MTSPESHSEKEQRTAASGSVTWKSISVRWHHVVCFGGKSARNGSIGTVGSSIWFEAAKRGAPTLQNAAWLWGNINEVATKRRGSISRWLSCPDWMRMKEAEEKKKAIPVLSARRKSAFYEWPVLQKDMAQPKKKDRIIQKEMAGGWNSRLPISACSPVFKIQPWLPGSQKF